MAQFIPQLKHKVRNNYEAGIKAGDILFTPSEVHTIHDGGIDFELRCAEALKHKPKPSPEEKAIDPFLPPYNGPHSLVAELQDESTQDAFVVLLNKYPVVERHFMLCTKDFAPQTMPPTPVELYSTLRILAQFDSTAEGLPREPHLAFFNCGELSGASQPHKHLQFVPLRLGEAPIDQQVQQAKPAELKAHECYSLPESVLAPANYIADLSKAAQLAPTEPEACQDLLGSILATMLDAAFDNFRKLAASGDEEAAAKVPHRMGQMSYNIVMTSKWIMLVPRSKGDYLFEDGDGKVPLNSLCWAGMLMTKEESHVDKLSKLGIRKMLSDVGVPRAKESADANDVP